MRKLLFWCLGRGVLLTKDHLALQKQWEFVALYFFSLMSFYKLYLVAGTQ
jgi:hypothetical protein